MKIQDVDARMLSLMVICRMREPAQRVAMVEHKKKATATKRRAKRATSDEERR